MKLIFISDNGSYHRKINFSWRSDTVLLFIFSVIAITLFFVSKSSKKDGVLKNEIQLLNKHDSLLMIKAKLEGQVKLLNSLGKNIATKSNIDIYYHKYLQWVALIFYLHQ